MSMITAFIMLIIGSNIARAFSLVGALSVIRFRTAIKSPLDVGFLFLSMAIGMACGTGFYAVAIVGAVLISTVIVLLQAFNFGSYPARRESLLSVLFPVDVDYESALDPLLQIRRHAPEAEVQRHRAFYEKLDGVDRRFKIRLRCYGSRTKHEVVALFWKQNTDRVRGSEKHASSCRLPVGRSSSPLRSCGWNWRTSAASRQKRR